MTTARALVLGGTGYVGSAVLRHLARAGVGAAFTHHRSVDRAHALARELGMKTYAMDLADPASVRRAVDAVWSDGTGPDVRPDVLINCATFADASQLLDIDDALFDRVMRINVHGVFTAVRAFVERLLASADTEGAREDPPGSRGDIVLVAGPDAAMATPSSAHFAASQQALVGLTRAAAAELGVHGIRINVLAVGVLDGGAGQLLSHERRANVERFSALARIGEADEVARAIVWLALENPYLSGVVVPVTGGL